MPKRLTEHRLLHELGYPYVQRHLSMCCCKIQCKLDENLLEFLESRHSHSRKRERGTSYVLCNSIEVLRYQCLEWSVFTKKYLFLASKCGYSTVIS